MFTYFKNAVYNSKPAQQYIQSRKLDYTKLEIGYNSGQFYHGQRKDETLIKQCLQVGLLQDAGLTSKTGDKAYRPFGKGCIVFPLRNKVFRPYQPGQYPDIYTLSRRNRMKEYKAYLQKQGSLDKSIQRATSCATYHEKWLTKKNNLELNQQFSE